MSQNFKNIDWDQAVEQIGPQLYRYFCGQFAKATASDLVQECLIRLIQKCQNEEFKSEKGSLVSYAFGIAKFVRLEAKKNQRKYEIIENIDVIAGADDRQYISDEVSHLRWAINQLKPDEQEIILLMIENDLTMQEISNLLEVPLNTIKSHIRRAKSNLRLLMEANYET